MDREIRQKEVRLQNKTSKRNVNKKRQSEHETKQREAVFGGLGSLGLGPFFPQPHGSPGRGVRGGDLSGRGGVGGSMNLARIRMRPCGFG